MNDILYFQNFDELFTHDVIFLVMCLKNLLYMKYYLTNPQIIPTCDRIQDYEIQISTDLAQEEC